MSPVNVEEEVFCREPRETAGGETSSVGASLLLVMVNCRVSIKVSASYITSAISTSDMTGGAANKDTKYSLNILIRYDWRSS